MKEEIIRMANEAGLYHFHDSEGQCDGITDARLVTEDKERDDDRLVEMLAPFAALVRADEREAILQMSREQWFKTQADFEDAIRARGQG